MPSAPLPSFSCAASRSSKSSRCSSRWISLSFRCPCWFLSGGCRLLIASHSSAGLLQWAYRLWIPPRGIFIFDMIYPRGVSVKRIIPLSAAGCKKNRSRRTSRCSSFSRFQQITLSACFYSFLFFRLPASAARAAADAPSRPRYRSVLLSSPVNGPILLLSSFPPCFPFEFDVTVFFL